jgi:hypothetical protein
MANLTAKIKFPLYLLCSFLLKEKNQKFKASYNMAEISRQQADDLNPAKAGEAQIIFHTS